MYKTYFLCKASAEVLAHVLDNPMSSRRDIINATGVSWNFIGTAMIRLEKMGFLKNFKRGKYTLATISGEKSRVVAENIKKIMELTMDGN